MRLATAPPRLKQARGRQTGQSWELPFAYAAGSALGTCVPQATVQQWHQKEACLGRGPEGVRVLAQPQLAQVPQAQGWGA